MVIGSHNSWSYLPPKHWWIRPFAFIARCQNVDIKTQYEKYGVRCFDLRVLFDKKGEPYLAHGFCKYKYNIKQLMSDLHWINTQKDCYVRILHEARRKSQYTSLNIHMFMLLCSKFEDMYPNIHFWCGRNLYNWEYDYHFDKLEPSCEELYSSVCAPKIIDDWYPKLFAIKNNKEIIKNGTNKDILLIDFVNIK